MLATPAASPAAYRAQSSLSGGSSSDHGQDYNDDEDDDPHMNNVSFEFDYPSPVKSGSTNGASPSPSPVTSSSSTVYGDEVNHVTGGSSSRDLRRTARGLEDSVASHSSASQGPKQSGMSLPARRSPPAAADRDGAQDIDRPRRTDRLQSKSQPTLAPAHPSPSASTTSEASIASPTRLSLNNETTATSLNATRTLRAALPPTTTPGATTARHRTSASASSAATAKTPGGAVSGKPSRLLGGAVRSVTPEERRRQADELARQQRAQEAMEAGRLARKALPETEEDDDTSGLAEKNRSPESVASFGSVGTSRTRRDEGGSQRSSPASTSVSNSSSCADSPRMPGNTPSPLGAHGHAQSFAARVASDSRRGPSPIARDYAASPPPLEHPPRPAYHSRISSDGRERERDAAYVSPPPRLAPMTAPSHPLHGQAAPHPTRPPPPPPPLHLPQGQQQQYVPHAPQSHLHAPPPPPQQHQSQPSHQQQYGQHSLGTYDSTPTAHTYDRQQQQQQQHYHPSHHQHQQLYESTSHQRHYAPMPPPLPMNGVGGMGAHVDQVVAVNLPGTGAAKKERTMVVNGRSYTKLCQIGRGGSSKVFKCLSEGKDLVAIKKVALDRLDSEAIRNYLNEIELLKSLRGDDKVIRLDDEETTRGTSGRPKAILVVMEFGEADFSKLLEEQKGKRLNMNFVGYFWLQMLECVKVVHDREIIHTDLKPANFVIVRGALKIIDFGISHKIEGDTVHVRREAQIGTLNYMSPESVQRSNGEPHIVLGKPTDVWALGCILYQMVYNHLPFSAFTSHPAKVAAITSPDYQIVYERLSTPVLVNLPSDEADRRRKEMQSPVDPVAIEVMRLCHGRSEKNRPDIEQLMEHDFLKPWKRSATPRIQTLPPDSTSVTREVLDQLISYARTTAHFTADDAWNKLTQLHQKWASGS